MKTIKLRDILVNGYAGHSFGGDKVTIDHLYRHGYFNAFVNERIQDCLMDSNYEFEEELSPLFALNYYNMSTIIRIVVLISSYKDILTREQLFGISWESLFEDVSDTMANMYLAPLIQLYNDTYLNDLHNKPDGFSTFKNMYLFSYMTLKNNYDSILIHDPFSSIDAEASQIEPETKATLLHQIVDAYFALAQMQLIIRDDDLLKTYDKLRMFCEHVPEESGTMPFNLADIYIFSIIAIQVTFSELVSRMKFIQFAQYIRYSAFSPN